MAIITIMIIIYYYTYTMIINDLNDNGYGHDNNSIKGNIDINSTSGNNEVQSTENLRSDPGQGMIFHSHE